jgi:hypothetical protein
MPEPANGDVRNDNRFAGPGQRSRKVAMALGTIVVLSGIVLLVGFGVVWFVIGKKRPRGVGRRSTIRDAPSVGSFGARSDAGAGLAPRARGVERIVRRPLQARSHAPFTDRWRSPQASFADDPGGEVRDTEALLEGAMRTRGYPGDFDERPASASVNHPRFTEGRRTARGFALTGHLGSLEE